MHTLNFSTDTFDQDNTFVVGIKGRTGTITVNASLHRGYKTEDDGIIWAMKHSACLKGRYTAKDIEETNRLGAMQPVCTGDVVVIDGHQYRARVLGDFSDCAIFDPA